MARQTPGDNLTPEPAPSATGERLPGGPERIERHLERMPLERDALVLAMRQFGTDFDSPHGRQPTKPSQPRTTTAYSGHGQPTCPRGQRRRAGPLRGDADRATSHRTPTKHECRHRGATSRRRPHRRADLQARPAQGALRQAPSPSTPTSTPTTYTPQYIAAGAPTQVHRLVRQVARGYGSSSADRRPSGSKTHSLRADRPQQCVRKVRIAARRIDWPREQPAWPVRWRSEYRPSCVVSGRPLVADRVCLPA